MVDRGEIKQRFKSEINHTIVEKKLLYDLK